MTSCKTARKDGMKERSLTGTAAHPVLGALRPGPSSVPVSQPAVSRALVGFHVTRADPSLAPRVSSHLPTLEAWSISLQTPRKNNFCPLTCPLLTQAPVLTSFLTVDEDISIPFWCVVGPVEPTKKLQRFDNSFLQSLCILGFGKTVH